MPQRKKLPPEVREDACPDGTADQRSNEGRRRIRSTTKKSPKDRQRAGTAGTEVKPDETRDKIEKVAAPSPLSRQPMPARDRSARSFRGKPRASLSARGGNALSRREGQRGAVEAGRSKTEASPSALAARTTLSQASPTSGPLSEECSGHNRGVPTSQGLLLTAKETSWVAAGRRGTTEASNTSLGHPAGSFTHLYSTQEKARTSTRKMAIIGFMCFVTILLFAAVITILVVTFNAHLPHPEHRQYCETLDCRIHARLLTAHLNRSYDPCEDFSAYVCSGWSPSGEHREHIKTPVDAIAFSRFADFRIILEEGTRKFAVGAKALNMYKSCMNEKDLGGRYLNQFRTLMSNMGLSWPEPLREDVDTLDILIALSYKWQVHLWIEVWVLALPHSGTWRLVIRPASVLPILINQYNNVKEITRYSAYWMGYFRDFNLNSTAFMNDSDLEAVITETHQIEGRILYSLGQYVFPEMESPIVFRLENIGSHSKPITSATWMTLLQKNVAVSPQLAASNDVQLSHEDLLKTVGSLIQDYPGHKILSQYSWMFIQQYAPIAEPRMLLRRFGNRHKVNAYRPIFCGFHVEATYKVLLLSLDIAARIKEEQMVATGAGFQRLVSAAVKKVMSTLWLDDDDKRVASVKITSVKMQVWPNENLTKNEELEEIYKDYPSAEGSFAEYWMHARRSISHASEKVRLINDSQAYWEALRLPLNAPPSYPNYDYVFGTLAVPVDLFDTPLLYTQGTNAMFFGGLGFLLALNLIKALDGVGVRWLPNGTNVDCIFPDEIRNAFQKKISCLKPDGVESVFPELPALQIAHAALEDADKGVNGSLYIQDLPPVNVFFMTICYMTCAVRGFKSAFTADCNKIVRNSAAFATAFNCPASSKMNPEKKCTFFD